eukprot:m.23686 g.23686  ORF g.23686 m.23686 type:complete len:687 (-) comp7532_c0_seq2:72-2132(-)
MAAEEANDVYELTASKEYSFQPEKFLTEPFEVEVFLRECRTQVSLAELQQDLGDYHASLKTALVSLINKDYGDFVNLSSNLVGLDSTLAKLSEPLDEIKQEVQDVKSKIDSEAQKLKEKIEQRSLVRERKVVLQRFLHIAASVEKIEALLGLGKNSDLQPIDGDLTGDSGQLIERVASEFNQLQFYVTECNRAAFLDSIAPRIGAITETLKTRLEQSFRRGIETQDAKTLKQCLRTYALIDKTQDVEQLFRDVVVAEFMKTAITSETVKNLSKLYETIYLFIDEKCHFLLQASAETGIASFDFMTNSVWPEISLHLAKFSSTFASTGNANEFHKNYVVTMKFIDKFEQLCGSLASVKRLRNHKDFISFRKCWSKLVYFQLRFQEIGFGLEIAFEQPLRGDELGEWKTPQGVKLESLLRQCWSDDIYIEGLAHRFWKLFLQLIVRFGSWIESLEAKDSEVDSMIDLASVYSDASRLGSQIMQIFEKEVIPRISIYFTSEDDLEKYQSALRESFKSLDEAKAKLKMHVTKRIAQLGEKECDGAKSIPRQYRHTGKKAPTTPSNYVDKIPAKLKAIQNALQTTFDSSTSSEWLFPAVLEITRKFNGIAKELLVSVKKTEESLSRLKKHRKVNDAGGMSDDDKIRKQISLDLTRFSELVLELTPGISDTEEMKYLLSMAESPAAIKADDE